MGGPEKSTDAGLYRGRTGTAAYRRDRGDGREVRGRTARKRDCLTRHCERSEAIHGAASGELDCFVAVLLAMTWRGQRLIPTRLVGLRAGLHQLEAVLDLAKQAGEILALLRREASQY